MNSITTYLLGFRDDIFKLLPMKETYDGGETNHIYQYLEMLIINAKGAMVSFPQLKAQKKYLTVANNLNYLFTEKELTFAEWRKIILKSTRYINDLQLLHNKDDGGGGDENGGR